MRIDLVPETSKPAFAEGNAFDPIGVLLLIDDMSGRMLALHSLDVAAELVVRHLPSRSATTVHLVAPVHGSATTFGDLALPGDRASRSHCLPRLSRGARPSF